MTEPTAQIVEHELTADGVCKKCNRCIDPHCCTLLPSCPENYVLRGET